MSSEPIRQISNSTVAIAARRVRYVVNDKVSAQVVDSQSGKVVREIPRQLSANLLENLYA